MQNTTIAFIGAGNMGHSLIGGLIADGYDPKHMWATCPEAEKLAQLAAQYGVYTTIDNQEGAAAADVVIFAVKPQVLHKVVLETAPVIQKRRPLVISIAAGVRTTDIQRWLGGNAAIVRCMPNTPALIRSGATALFANAQVSAEQKNLAESIMRAVGLTVWLSDEKQLETVTALSGSGPAYFFRMIEALEQAAVAAGLPVETAHLLTLQTALGAARMALESAQPVKVLREQVTSPAGTTERALEVLEAGGINKLFESALHAAEQRAHELGEMFGKE